MRFSMLGIAAGFALAANAFLVPSTMDGIPNNVAAHEAEIFRAAGAMKVDPFKQVLTMECTGCVGAGESKNDLLLDIHIPEDRKSLFLNTYQLLPRDNVDSANEFLALVVPQSATASQLLSPSPDSVLGRVRLSAIVRYDDARTSPENPQWAVRTILVQPFEVNEVSASFDVVRIDVLVHKDGQLAIMKAAVEKRPGGSGTKQGNCNSRLCRLMNMTGEQAQKYRAVLVKGCHRIYAFVFRVDAPQEHHGHHQGHSHSHVKPGADKDNSRHLPTHNRVPIVDGKVRNGRPCRGRHSHGVARLFRQALHIVNIYLVPMLLGLATGATMGAVTVMIAVLVTRAWIRLRGNAFGDYEAVPANEETVETKEDVNVTDVVNEKEKPPMYE